MAVRRESVVISVDSNMTAVMARDAAAIALVRQQLDGLNNHPIFRANASGNVVRIDNRNITQTTTNIRNLERTSTSTNASLNQTGRSINQLTGRLGLFADAALILGPGLVPIAAVGATAIGGLAIAATAAATAGAAAIVAFQGVGDAVKAADEYGVDPSAENLAKYQEAMQKIGPEAQKFVRHFQNFRPVMSEIRDSAAAGLFPGLTASLDDFERVAPRISEILNLVGSEMGDIIDDSAGSLASSRWAGFLGYLRDELPDALRSLSNIMGDIGHGAATLMQRLDPGNDRFLAWLESVADGFDDWASSSEGRDDIRAFLEYARESGPEVAKLFTSLVGALAAIVTAAAPLGGPVLTGLTAIADMIQAIAESDAATPLLAAYAAFRLYARGAALAAGAQARLNTTQRTGASTAAANAAAVQRAGLTGTALGAALAAPRPGDAAAAARAQRMANVRLGAQGAALGGMVALSSTGLGALTEEAGASNTAMLALLGTMIAPGWGTAAGAITGSLIDMASANNDLNDSLDRADLALQGKDLSAAAKNLSTARAELEKYREGQDIGTWELPSFGDGLQNFKDDVQTLLGKPTDGDAAEAKIRQLEDLYRAQSALANLKPVAAWDGLNTLFGDLTGSITPTTNALRDFTTAMEAANGFLSYRAGMVQYEAAIDAVTESIKENGRSLDRETKAGQANITALDGVATVGLRIAETLKGTKRNNFLRGLASDVRAAGKAFGMGKDEIDAYLEDLGLLDRKVVKPKVDLDTERLNWKQRAALRRIAELGGKSANPFVDLYTGPLDSALSGARSDLANFDGASATAYINVVARKIGNALNPFGSADGSTVPKTGLPYADRHHYLLADGEEVISNRYGQADRHRSLLKAINAGQLADGGTAMRAADARRYQAHASRSASTGTRGPVQVNVGDLTVSGTLNTPWGPAQVEGVARAAARDEIDADRRFDNAHG